MKKRSPLEIDLPTILDVHATVHPVDGYVVPRYTCPRPECETFNEGEAVRWNGAPLQIHTQVCPSCGQGVSVRMKVEC